MQWLNMFYSHVIYLGTKIDVMNELTTTLFYSHVIYLGTKIFIVKPEKLI